MGTNEKTLEKVLRGTSDANVDFSHLCHLLVALGFQKRTKGDHHIFTKRGIEEIINIQPKGKLSKPYQVRQAREIILKYKLEAGNSEI